MSGDSAPPIRQDLIRALAKDPAGPAKLGVHGQQRLYRLAAGRVPVQVPEAAAVADEDEIPLGRPLRLHHRLVLAACHLSTAWHARCQRLSQDPSDPLSS